MAHEPSSDLGSPVGRAVLVELRARRRAMAQRLRLHDGSQPGWNQSWRVPLREALDWLRGFLAEPVAASLRAVARRSPGSSRRLRRRAGGPRGTRGVRGQVGRVPCSEAETSRILELLELERHLLSAFTSCGWFFADPTGIETLLSLRHAALVLDTAERVLGLDCATGFLDRLEAMGSNTDPATDRPRSLGRFVEPPPSRREIDRRGFRLGGRGRVGRLVDAARRPGR